MDHLKSTDPEIFEAIRAEEKRQSAQLELIASENFVSRAVLQAMGTVMANKYAEGLPGKRYYGGCEYVDVAEDLARRSCHGALRGRSRQRSGPLRSSGEHGGVLRLPGARG